MAAVKRKAAASAGAAVSKKKQSKVAAPEPTLISIGDIKAISVEIDEKKSYNSLVKLLDQFKILRPVLLEGENEEVESIARLLTLTVYKSFKKLFEDQLLVAKKSYTEKKLLVVKWLLSKYDSFKEILLEWVVKTDFGYETSVEYDMLDIYMSLIKLESSNTADPYFPTSTYRALIEGLLQSNTDNESVILEFNEKYFIKYWDLQFYFYHGLDEILLNLKDSNQNNELIASNFFAVTLASKLLFDMEDQKSSPNWSVNKDEILPNVAYKPSNFKSSFQKSIIAILSYRQSTAQYKEVLLILHKRIIPYMAQPQNLMDFLTDCYNVTDDEVVPILALNSLYELMKRYNLEYPDFYTKLYSLLTPNLLYTRYRSRFFRLCDLFLSSTHLSSKLVASFIKKLAVLSIRSSASGVVIVIPFIYNLMKRHPACMVMLHRPDISSSDFTDPFKVDETDPLKTGALNSSLWELETLMSHYHPNIATLAKIFGEPFRKQSYNMEDFLDWSYITLLDSEKTRKYRIVAALEYEQWDNIFDTQNKKSEATTVYASGWSL